MQHIDISCEPHPYTSNKYAMLDRDSEELVSFEENEELDIGEEKTSETSFVILIWSWRLKP